MSQYTSGSEIKLLIILKGLSVVGYQLDSQLWN